LNANTEASDTAAYYECTLKAGYYNLAGVDLAHHTYAVAEKNGVAHVMLNRPGFRRQSGPSLCVAPLVLYRRDIVI